MEYRDQLKYIKSHQISDGTDMRKGKKMKKRKAGKLDRLLWVVQLVSSAFFAGAMVILGILPLKYMAVLIVVILLLLLLVRSMQKRALKSRKKKRSGKGIAVITSLVFLVGGFYALKVNAALDKIATGEENGQYVQAHAMEVTEQPFNVYISGIDVSGPIST